MAGVGDPTLESVAITPDRGIGGLQLTRHLDQLAMGLGLPRIIRSDNYAPEIVGNAMLDWAHGRNNVNSRQIETGRLCQNAYIKTPV